MSKLCNILCDYKLLTETDKRITVNAFNPSLMANTNFNSANNLIINAITNLGMNAFEAVLGRLGNAKNYDKALRVITLHKYDGLTAKYIDRDTTK
ncbi:hypothetical protein C5Z25_05460 [Lactobacillus sp. CBA3605]|nr:hypothetical protein C5Z25_05460 [Lactobacillus sp. CBA3605]